VTAVRHDEDSDTALEGAQRAEEGVVDEFGVVQTPRLVDLVGFVAGDVGDLSAVARVGEEEEVARVELRGGVVETVAHGIDGGVVVEQQLRLESAAERDVSHGGGIVHASRQCAVPTAVLAGIDLVQTDVK
jgi:hypothetical protein